MRSLIIRSFHNDEIRFAFVHGGRLYTLMMKWNIEFSRWRIHSFDQELIQNPGQYHFVVQVLLADERVIDFLKKRKIDPASVETIDYKNVLLDS